MLTRLHPEHAAARSKHYFEESFLCTLPVLSIVCRVPTALSCIQTSARISHEYDVQVPDTHRHAVLKKTNKMGSLEMKTSYR